MRGFFITGTGTEVGKTYVGALIAGEMARRGIRIGVYKPVASDCLPGEGEWGLAPGELVATDALALWQAAGEPLTLQQACPQRFKAAVAPNIAARMEGTQVDAELLRTGIEPWLDACDIVLVEGAGGLMSPVSDDDYNADLAADLGLPLIVVAANRLGVINDTLQTVITASVFGDGLDVAGVVLNQAAEVDNDESLNSNAAELREHLRVPLLGEVGFGHQGGVAEVVDQLMSSK
ncbi:dethiobiotin synthase [Aeoliella mucimassa]|uniref:ATP-dependent dethiobiotin synthetase BioD n=1 Tax=Aeoliella mucimassa TaxID=2527972 RepID=A0A518AIA9_9BACT|nr:dethiobiotin synthase [Aeoliella mucimassa]QDU54458.1 ATP-dependent dethiobiotin synthetase BioD [Aeoliella mucimassa]